MERFWSKVEKTEDCWNWTAFRDKGGYGRFNLNYLPQLAHRVAYTLSGGVIPENLQLDHRCGNRACVNPAHLEPVTQQENIRRGKAGAYWAAKTHCPHGHEYTEENTYRYPSNGRRECRICRRGRHS